MPQAGSVSAAGKCGSCGRSRAAPSGPPAAITTLAGVRRDSQVVIFSCTWRRRPPAPPAMVRPSSSLMLPPAYACRWNIVVYDVLSNPLIGDPCLSSSLYLHSEAGSMSLRLILSFFSFDCSASSYLRVYPAKSQSRALLHYSLFGLPSGTCFSLASSDATWPQTDPSAL